MNQLGRDALRAAALAGTTQAFGMLRRADGARCAVGVLLELHANDLHRVIQVYDLAGQARCSICGSWFRGEGEYSLAMHLNDTHECDFFKIASLMPVSPES